MKKYTAFLKTNTVCLSKLYTECAFKIRTKLNFPSLYTGKGNAIKP